MNEVNATVIEIEKAAKSELFSRKLPQDPFMSSYGDGGVIQPPYDLTFLAQMIEMSSILPQCIEAMEVNVDGFGYVMEPMPWVKPGEDGNYSPELLAEKERAEIFFDYANPELSYSQIRRRSRKDLESTGNAYWEILRDGKGEIAGIEHLESHTIRLCMMDRDPVPMEMPILGKDGKVRSRVTYRKRFRRYVQERDGARVFFKELGDPRDISSRTGRTTAESDADLATEVLHWRNYCATSPYGIPRWVGVLLAILGSREADEVNYEYFGNKSIPPLALLVGGKLAANAANTIRDYIRDNLKGRKGFHSILVVEADSTGSSNPVAPAMGGGKATLSFEKLTDAQQGDALFQNYDKGNRDKVRSAFRLPPVYVGETTDYNRATANESQRVAEEQVFRPEREEHDFVINRRILPLLGVSNWWYRSMSPVTDDPTELTNMLKVFCEVGLTVREARTVIANILNEELPAPEDADWLDLPLSVYLERLRLGSLPEDGEEEPHSVELVKSLVDLRSLLAKERDDGHLDDDSL